MKNKLFILDDHVAIAKGLEYTLQCDWLDISQSHKFSDLVKSLKLQQIDLLILDYELNEGVAADMIPLIRKLQPDLPIIIYTMHHEPWIIALLVKLSVNGIIIKSDALHEITIAVSKVIKEKQKYFSPQALNTLLAMAGDSNAKQIAIYTPSPRELEIIDLLSHGMTSDEIAQQLLLSKNTIDTMRKNILLKSEATNVSHLMRIAFMKGWIKS